MKKTTKNGAGTRTAKTSHPDRIDALIPLKRLECCCDDFTAKCEDIRERGGDLEAALDKARIGWDDLPPRVQVMVARERASKATVRLEMELPAWVYGHLCEAAVVTGVADWRAALAEYLSTTVLEWSNNGYVIDP